MRRIGALLAGAALALALGGVWSGVARPAESLRGGLLRVDAPVDPARPTALADAMGAQDSALDPARDTDDLELFRCCLLRTLLSSRGVPIAQGGTVLRPDLAAALPVVSADELTWTFHLRPGIRYAPPLETLEVTSADIVRALERYARLRSTGFGGDGYSGLGWSVIRGFDAYAARRADAISGLETPDRATLVVRLTRPRGDLDTLFSAPVTAPLPPSSGEVQAPFGIAAGHDKWFGRYLVGTGPYMIAGTDRLDLTRPPRDQRPVAGFTPNRRLVLVRNPSWDRATDDLRPAYSDRIEVHVGGTVARDVTRLDADRTDVLLPPHGRVPLAVVRRYLRHPARGQVVTTPNTFIGFVGMNLAQPPFDDIHVRRAVAWAINRRRLQAIDGGPLATAIATHVAPDAGEADILLHYDPFRTPGERGSLARARAEMRQSRYDRNHDGICDAPACDDVLALTLKAPLRDPRLAPAIAHDLAGIGLRLRVDAEGPSALTIADDPTRHVAMTLSLGAFNAGPDYLGQFTSPSLQGGGNWSLTGASPAQLRRWGYSVLRTPGIEERYAECSLRLGAARAPCWAGLDQYVMEKVVPWVPYRSDNAIALVPRRVVRFSYDVGAIGPALDRIAVLPHVK